MIDEPESTEVFIRDGEVWIPDGLALVAKLGASYLYFDEGELYAGVAGEGEFTVRDLLAENAAKTPRRSVVTPIK